MADAKKRLCFTTRLKTGTITAAVGATHAETDVRQRLYKEPYHTNATIPESISCNEKR